MKIAVPVSDNKSTIAKRMGRSPFFAIYTITNNVPELLEYVENEHAKEHHHGGGHGGERGGEGHEGHHHDHVEEHSDEEVKHHRQQLGSILGCDYILTRAVGPNMKDALAQTGINVVKMKVLHGSEAEEIVQYFHDHKEELLVQK